VLDMGEPVRIVELARQMIRLAGRTENEIRIEFSGLRPGEKLYEELLADADDTLPTRIERLRIAKLSGAQVRLDELLTLAEAATGDARAVRERLRAVVSEYREWTPA